TLYLPEQVKHEFDRNRDNKIADAIKRFKAETLSDQFPQICKEYEEYTQIRNLIKEYKQLKSRLLDKVVADYSEETLKADKIIRRLFDKAKFVGTTDTIWERAKRRYDLGNPPGKDGSYGDAVNWECLLEAVEDEQDLYFVTDDGDYCSKTDDDQFSPYLKKEWLDKKKGEVRFFKRLSGLFRDQFPSIRLATELEKDLLIRDLQNSRTFATTRNTLKNLSASTDFTAVQLNEIVEATITNNQIYWIATDADINSYLKRLTEDKHDLIIPGNLRRFLQILSGEKAEKQVLPERSIRRECYEVLEQAMKSNEISYNVLLYGEMDNNSESEGSHVYSDDVAAYVVQIAGHSVYLLPLIWIFDEEELAFRRGRIEGVLSTNEQTNYHLVFCDEGWTPENIEHFRASITIPGDKSLTVSTIEDWRDEQLPQVI
ncbi:MAG: hypothetical protein JWN14_2702, partial [Chthonomonadales bacterium]|nr:hypothetical protein [Chthonomonadales bacterium]